MTENFNLLRDQGEKAWGAVKHELQEHPKTAFAIGAGVVLAAAVAFKHEELFPSAKQLLSDWGLLGDAEKVAVDNSIPRTAEGVFFRSRLLTNESSAPDLALNGDPRTTFQVKRWGASH